MSSKKAIQDVTRSHEEAAKNYTRISGIYDVLEGIWEKKYRKQTLQKLAVKPGEQVLEIGYGTGHDLKDMAEKVGPEGKIYGIDLSEGMCRQTRKRLGKAGLLDRTNLQVGNALNLPYENGFFDVAYMSFTLELFDTPEIPEVLSEVKRVLKSGGRFGVVSLSKEDHESLLTRLYEKGHEWFPKLLDCRPIYVAASIEEAGFKIVENEHISIVGLDGKIVIGQKS